MAMWGGRFSKGMDPLFAAFQRSLPVDRRFFEHEIEGSKAWARALADAGVLSAPDRDALLRGLESVRAKVASNPSLLEESAAEDVHTFVEDALEAEIGPPARRLHAGRSRNEQVSADLRLFARSAGARAESALKALESALVALAERGKHVPVPGFTHLRAAQPILFAHWALAHFSAFERDRARLAAALSRAEICPLGSGAIAGCPFPVDRAALAASLGFPAVTANSVDAVSDRDFVAECLFVAALCFVHLSRLAEDLVLYSSPEFGFIDLDESVCTGSSLLPQKKNPDALELARGGAGGALGALFAVLANLKGLPLAYDRDFQEANRPFVEGMEAWARALEVAARVVEGVTVRSERCTAAAAAGFATATEVADFLVRRGVPFRDAHEATGKVVRRCIERGTDLASLPLVEYRAIDPRFDEGLFETISVEAALAARDLPGGTAPSRVAAAIEEAKARLERSAR
jgi:argininosuccinate lyase